jgi:hypothetical protein
MAAQLADATLAGEPIASVIATLVQQVLIVSRRGFWLDYADAPVDRPYLVAYDAEQIVDWDTIVVSGDTRLSYLVLREVERTRNDFQVTVADRYRRIRLVDGLVEVELWKKAEDGKTWVVTETKQPTRRGARLDFIPFVFVNADGITPPVRKPVLLDLVDLNLSHYRTSADLEHGRHFTGLPQPVVIGANPQTSLRIGSASVWPLPAGGDAKYMEFTGAGLKTLENALDQKERQMAVLGTRMLEQQKKTQEAADTVRLRHAGDDATLASIVGACEQGVTWLLRRWAWWAGFSQDLDDAAIGVTLNKEWDGVDIPIDGLSLLAQADKISFATLYFNLQRLGLTRPDVTAEQERQQILSEGGADPMAPRLPTPEPEVA